MSRTLLLVASCVLGGCVVNEESLAIVEQSVITPNGSHPNGVSSNGINPNAISLNGSHPNGSHPNGAGSDVTLNGVSPTGVNPNATPVGISTTSSPLAGSNLVGTMWSGHLSTGATVVLRLDAAQQLTGANSDVWSFLISVSADGTFRPLCLDAAGAAIYAISVQGTWNMLQGVAGGGAYQPNSSDFTVACRGSAIAKSVEFGYKPWLGRTTKLATSVRALRADYCGDGTPNTVDGTIINIFDADGIETDDAAWIPEAEWTPDGARCISSMFNTRFYQVAHTVPSCFPNALTQENSCGTGFTDGAVIITELPPH
jgi:hypothetical protein